MSWGIFKIYDRIKEAKTPRWIVRAGDRLPASINNMLVDFLIKSIQVMMDKGIAITDIDGIYKTVKDQDVRKLLQDKKNEMVENLKELSR